MAKGKSKLDQLPYRLRVGVYERLLDGVKVATIVRWLFEQANENDPPNKAGEVWQRGTATPELARWNCQVKVYDAYKSAEFAAWKKQHLKDSDLKRFADGMEAKLQAAGTEGDALLKNVVMYGVEQILGGEAKAQDIQRLVASWTQLRGLKKDDALAAALEAKLKSLSGTGAEAGTDYQGKLNLLSQVLEEGFKA
jgi:hypothetical protein